jgi:hypothetical protein
MRPKNKNFMKFNSNLRDVWDMNNKDIQRNCIIRGMPFDEHVKSSTPYKVNWLMANFHHPTEPTLLDQYDDWMETEIKTSIKNRNGSRKDWEILVKPEFRLGYFGEKDDDGTVISTKRVPGIKKPKLKRVKTEDGIFQGTKKAFVFSLQKEGFSKKGVLKRVMAQFPEASEKSVGIWFNQAKKKHDG